MARFEYTSSGNVPRWLYVGTSISCLWTQKIPFEFPELQIMFLDQRRVCPIVYFKVPELDEMCPCWPEHPVIKHYLIIYHNKQQNSLETKQKGNNELDKLTNQ